MKQFNNNRGFTFIELILYVSIVTIILTAVIPFAWAIITSRTKSSTEQEVFSQARYVSERLKYEIRNAYGIDPASSFGVNLANNSSQILRLTVNPPPTTVVQQSVVSCGIDCKEYTLGVTCQNLPERIVYLEERGLGTNGTVFFFTGIWGIGYYPDAIPEYARSQGFQTYRVSWGGSYGWATGAAGSGKKAMCGPAEVVKWVKDKNIAINSEVMCATGNSGGAVQIASGLSQYDGLEDYLDMVILTGGPQSRFDIGCFNAGDPAYFPIGNPARDQVDYMIGGNYCVTADGSNPTVVKQFQDESLASPTDYRDYDFPKTKVNFVNSVNDWTAADEQGKFYYNQLPNDPSRKSWYDIPGTEHNIYITLDGSAKIKELLSSECIAVPTPTPIGPTPTPTPTPAPSTSLDISVVASGGLQIIPPGGYAVLINSSDIKVTDLTFTNYTSADNKTKHIGFTLTVESNLPGQSQEFKEKTTIRSSAEMRNN